MNELLIVAGILLFSIIAIRFYCDKKYSKTYYREGRLRRAIQDFEEDV